MEVIAAHSDKKENKLSAMGSSRTTLPRLGLYVFITAQTLEIVSCLLSPLSPSPLPSPLLLLISLIPPFCSALLL